MIPLSGFLFPGFLYQFFDLADCTVVTGTWTQSLILLTAFIYVWAKANRQKTTYLLKKNTGNRNGQLHSSRCLTYWYPGSPIFFNGQKCMPFQSPLVKKTFLRTTEHSWTKTILSKGHKRKLFNPGLMNKLIRIERVRAIQLPSKLMNDVCIHEQ